MDPVDTKPPEPSKFPCCGGNDEHPQRHCMDCEVVQKCEHRFATSKAPDFGHGDDIDSTYLIC